MKNTFILSVNLLLFWFLCQIQLVSYGQAFGNTYINGGTEIIIQDITHPFQTGGNGLTAGIVGTVRGAPHGCLSFKGTADWTGASNIAHVDGYVKTYMPSSFIFPIGDNGKCRHAAISASNPIDPTEAAYFCTSPAIAITSSLLGGNEIVLPLGAPFSLNALGVGISAVDDVEYWDINGNTAAKISLTWDRYSGINTLTTGNLNRLCIVGWNGSQWTIIPSTVDATSVLGTSSTLFSGSITTNANITPNSFTVYTLAAVCLAGSTAPGLSSTTVSNTCPNSTVNLNTFVSSLTPLGASLVWYIDSTHSERYLTPTQALAGEYYAFYYDNVGDCYSPVSPKITVSITGCIGISPSDMSCNSKMPWVNTTFSNVSASIIDNVPSAIPLCVGSVNNIGNLVDGNLSNFTSINITGVGCNATLSVRDNDGGDTYPAGSFAGFEVSTNGLLSTSIATTVTIETYNNGSFAQSYAAVTSLVGINTSLINSNGHILLGFITGQDFDEVRITYQTLVGVLYTAQVYHAVVERFCTAPALACNTFTQMNNSSYPTIINSTHTGITGLACVSCSITDAENAISSNTGDFATLTLAAALGTTASIAVGDVLTDYSVGSFAGFNIENPSLVDVDLLSGLTIKTYLNGSLQETSNAGTLVSLGSSLLSGTGKQTVGIITTQAFDEVRLEITNLLGVLNTTKVYNAVFESFCAGSSLDCNTQTALTKTKYPVAIDNLHSGIHGLVCVGCSVNNAENVISPYNKDFGTISLIASVGVTGSIAVKDVITDYPAGTFVGFNIENPILVDANLLSGISIHTYLNGGLQESILSATLLSANSSLLSGLGTQTVGFVTTMDCDEVEIEVSNLLGVLNNTKVYNAVFERFCDGPPLVCNTPTTLYTPEYPVFINNKHTGINGVACVGCNVNNSQNLISDLTSDYATIILLGGIGATGSISVKNQLSDYATGTYAGFEIENTSILDASLLDGITITTYLDNSLQEFKTGISELIAAGTSLLTDDGIRTVGFISTMPFDEIQITISNTIATDIGNTKIYKTSVERFCPVTLLCNETYWLSNPTFPVVIDGNLTGKEGAVCALCSVNDAPNTISENPFDYATITVAASVLASGSIAVLDGLTTYPAGGTVGFAIQDVNNLLQLDLFNSLTICTYNNGLLQECKSGTQLIDLAVLFNILGTGPGIYNIGFKTSLPFDEVRIKVGSLASALNIIRVYSAYYDTRGAVGGGLVCCNAGSVAPSLSANTLSNYCPLLTANLNRLVVSTTPVGAILSWFTDSLHTTPYASPTTATDGTYYAFYQDTVNNCFSPASPAVQVSINNCLNPDIGVTYVDVTLNGDVSTNDNTLVLSTYGLPISFPSNPSLSIPTVNADGTYTFITSVSGVYQFNVPVCSPSQTFNCPTSILTITVLDAYSLSNPPVANVDLATTIETNPIIIRTLDNDDSGNPDDVLNPGSVSIVTPPQNGNVMINPTTGNTTYTANNGFIGIDTLIYQVCNNQTPPLCATAYQIINVLPIGIQNTTGATDDYISIAVNTAGTGNVLSNDIDPENDAQTVTSQNITNASGNFILNNDGSFVFTPALDFTGPVQFIYRVCDNGSPIACADATLHILVEPIYGSISGITFSDGVSNVANTADGIRSIISDSGIPNVSILVCEGVKVLRKISSKTDGTYTFPYLKEGGVYQIAFERFPSGCPECKFTTFDVGANTNDTLDSDVNPNDTIAYTGKMYARTSLLTPLAAYEARKYVDAGYANAGSAFPIELLDFEVHLNHNDGVLHWITAKEINGDHFEILRSLDNGTTFEHIGNIQSSGNSNHEQNYSFTDIDIAIQLTNNPFYQIKMVDIDNSTQYSNIVELILQGPQSYLYVYPTIATSTLILEYQVLATNTELKLVNTLGQTLYGTILSSDSGKLNLDISQLTQGAYYLQLTTQKEIKTVKFIKQ